MSRTALGAIRDALPGPLALLNVNEAPDKARLIASVVFMALDAGLNYADSVEEVELQYLQDGWTLDDEQAATLHEIRKGTFNYMVETVRDYDLPGELALTEQAVADYVEWENNSNDLQVIRFFEDNEATYRAFGPYWLALARRYYDVGDYAACLRAFDAYEQLDMDIFRRDYDLAQALPLAIVAARNVQEDAQYAQTAARYVQSILDNTDHDDWALRYFVAQTCVELCALTGDESYLQQAYDIALSNVNDLVTQQRVANAAYLAEVEKAEAPQGATEEQKKDVEDYNRMLTEERKAELPPTDEALLLNCDLLFALADELGVSDAQAPEHRRHTPRRWRAAVPRAAPGPPLLDDRGSAGSVRGEHRHRLWPLHRHRPGAVRHRRGRHRRHRGHGGWQCHL